MITIYNIIDEIKEDREYIQKILIGGLLMFIPIVNFFALGYLYRYAAQIVSTGRYQLPEWDSWGKLFVEGVIFICIIFIFGFLPVLIGWFLSHILNLLTFGFLGWFPFFPLSITLLIAPSLTLLAVFSLIKGQNFSALFKTLNPNLKKMYQFWKQFLLGNITFIGLCFIGLPLCGFAFFIGLLLLIPYTLVVLSNLDNR